MPAVIPGALKGINGELGVHFRAEPVGNYLSCEQVDDNAEIIETAVHADVGDIADPNLIWCGRVEVLLQVVRTVGIGGICRKNRFGFDS